MIIDGGRNRRRSVKKNGAVPEETAPAKKVSNYCMHPLHTAIYIYRHPVSKLKHFFLHRIRPGLRNPGPSAIYAISVLN